MLDFILFLLLNVFIVLLLVIPWLTGVHIMLMLVGLFGEGKRKKASKAISIVLSD